MFQHTAARRRLESGLSRLNKMSVGFNTQPPEGGWSGGNLSFWSKKCFNTQPPEGGWGT